MAKLAVEFREHLLKAQEIQEDFVKRRTITIIKHGYATEFDWEHEETRYPDETSRRWRNGESEELPAARAKQLVEVYFDADESE